MIKLTPTELTPAQTFYQQVLRSLNDAQLTYIVGGGIALKQYTGIERASKDLDLFCKPSEYTKIVKHFSDLGYHTEITDSRWLAKIFSEEGQYVDIIFNTVNNICKVDDDWLDHAGRGELYDVPVRIMAPEEVYWCKLYVQNRERFDGADLNHLVLRYGDRLDWHRLWARMEQHWHLLLAQLLTFQFCYPAERDLAPRWLMDQLLNLAKGQYDLPAPQESLCLGTLIDQTQYGVDVLEWNYKAITMRTV